MSQRKHCDICEEEMGEIWIETKNRRTFEALPAARIETSAGDICLYCLIDALQKLDKRARPA